MRETVEFIAHTHDTKGMETNIDRAKMAEVSKIITKKQDDPWNGERPGQDAKKPGKKQTIITYRRISKRLAVETTSLLLYMFYYSIPSLLKSKHAISITCAEMHADHIVSSGSPHNVLHFSSYYYYYHYYGTYVTRAPL